MVFFLWQQARLRLLTVYAPPEPREARVTSASLLRGGQGRRAQPCKGSGGGPGMAGHSVSVDLAFSSFVKAAYTVLGFIPFLFNQPPQESPFLSAHNSFQWELRFTSPGCPLLPARRPHTAAPLAAGVLQLVACSTVLLETYARRLRHTIAASFFRAQEARRIRHLYARLQRSYDRNRDQQPLVRTPS